MGVRPQVSETIEPNERKLSGTIRLFTAFVIGALFVLAPAHYFYMGREPALNESQVATDTRVGVAQPPAPSHSAADRGTPPFASRMTYELSRLPEEPLPVVARGPLPAVAPVPHRSTASAQPAEPRRETRFADARPISTRPPDPRDRTAAIEQEAHKPEYREAPQRDAGAVRGAKALEAREVDPDERRLSGTPTRPIAAEATASSRGELAGPPVAGVTPITRAPEKLMPSEAAAPVTSVSAVPAAAANRAAGVSIENRLAATREWLNVAAKTTHTIQLLGASSEAQLQAQLKSLGRLIEPSRLYVYRTMAHGKPSITVVYGEYSDRKSALQALNQLPPVLVANKPVLRTVNGIRAEMKQHKTDG